MSTAHTLCPLTAGDPPMSQRARMHEAYFVTLERQAMRFETVASKLEDDDKRAILDIVAGLRKEVQTLRNRLTCSPNGANGSFGRLIGNTGSPWKRQ